jgi:hypothetical protein
MDPKVGLEAVEKLKLSAMPGIKPHPFLYRLSYPGSSRLIYRGTQKNMYTLQRTKYLLK